MPNLPQELTGLHCTDKRHFVALSHPLIKQFLNSGDFKGLLKFVLQTTLDILRGKLKQEEKLKVFADRVDDLGMVELCVHYKVISYSDFIQIVQVINVSNSCSEACV